MPRNNRHGAVERKRPRLLSAAKPDLAVEQPVVEGPAEAGNHCRDPAIIVVGERVGSKPPLAGDTIIGAPVLAPEPFLFCRAESVVVLVFGGR